MMPTSATVPAISQQAGTSQPARWRDLLIGVMIVAVAPASFWTAVMVAAARALELDLPLWGLAVPSVLMLALLVCVWSSIAVSSRAGSEAE